MGGYATFVWPALGLVLTVLAGLLIISVRQLRAAEEDLSALEPHRQRGRRKSVS